MTDLNKYLAELQAHLTTGEAREHTYRPALISLFESFNDIQAANDQARTAHGATDFVYRSKSNLDIVLGYGEAKDINVSLDKTEKTEQLDRYSGYNNLLLTNGIEFRFYKNGKRYSQVEIAKLNSLSLTAIPENFQNLIDEIQSFFEQPPEVIKSGKRLSEIMGAKARRIRTNINILLDANSKDETRAAEISKVYQLMKNLLVHDLEPDKFADMYAQTLVYGLFVARYNDKTPDNFSRVEARDLIPASNPFLREFFDHIAGPRFEKGLSIIVDELCQVFSVSDVKDIIDKHLKLNESDQTDAKDPIIHFYEDFLSEYNPAERKKMGAYYTPLPVVQFMVRAVDEILKQDFGLTKGLADSSRETHDVVVQGKKAKQSYHKVQVLDPATGTATFLNEIIKFVHLKFKGQEGLWPSYARDNLVPRLSGFELMMGAYTIAHMKLGLTLKNLGVDDIGQRLGIYLTNSLEEGIPKQHDLFSFGLSEAVTHEAEEAAKIKSERPIMVVIGNPPYSGVSSNNTPYANSLVNKYKFEPGGLTKLKERNPKWINDDYVKFIAFAENMIAKNGEGVLAYITNHGYLDNPTFRGMRWHLAKTFDEIKIVDLHGNSKKKEVAPNGGKDENVFDIQQGVAIILAVKKPGSGNNKKLAKVSVADIYGKRKDKFSTLDKGDIKFKQIKLDDKMLYFANKNTEGKEEYETGFSVADLFIVNSVGVVTSGDDILTADTRHNLIENIEKAKRSDQNRKVIKKIKEIIDQVDEDKIKKMCFRPLENRYIYYDSNVLERSRSRVMLNYYNGDNIGLIAARSQKYPSFNAVFASQYPSELKCGESSVGSCNFPLWSYDEQGNKTSNLKPEIVKAIKLKAGEASEQDIFDYIYGVLHWPAYREKYKEFLKIDFPRVPYPANQAEFNKFRAVGEKLRGLHLMTDPSVNDFITTFPIAGTNEVVKLKYEDGKVYINETQYFGDVPEVAWNFYIGGYQPAQKWLKDRKNRTLSFEDIEHYQKIIKVLSETSRVMEGM